MKRILLLTAVATLLFTCEQQTAVIGSIVSPEGESSEILVGNTAHQQIWVDYIEAHNNRALDKIAAINADDWVGYPPNGMVIKGNEAHITFLDEWFKSDANPKWTVKWMIANKGENEEGVMEEWLTTGNDIKFVDEAGNEVTEHHIHDIKFDNEKIKEIYVYARPKPAE